MAIQLTLSEFRNATKLVSYVLPVEGRRDAVKLRWLQVASIESTGELEDWAIDSLIIDSPIHLISPIDDGYQMDQPNNSPIIPLHQQFGSRLWWRLLNAKSVQSFCGRIGEAIFIAKSNSDEDSVLETSDFVLNGNGTLGLSFDLNIGGCISPIGESAAAKMLLPIRLEMSVDYGVSWRMFHPLKLRGESGTGPQLPSLFYETSNQWKTYRFSLQSLSTFK